MPAAGAGRLKVLGHLRKSLDKLFELSENLESGPWPELLDASIRITASTGISVSISISMQSA